MHNSKILKGGRVVTLSEAKDFNFSASPIFFTWGALKSSRLSFTSTDD
jgi:hypothetical protein